MAQFHYMLVYNHLQKQWALYIPNILEKPSFKFGKWTFKRKMYSVTAGILLNGLKWIAERLFSREQHVLLTGSKKKKKKPDSISIMYSVIAAGAAIVHTKPLLRMRWSRNFRQLWLKKKKKKYTINWFICVLGNFLPCFEVMKMYDVGWLNGHLLQNTGKLTGNLKPNFFHSAMTDCAEKARQEAA